MPYLPDVRQYRSFAASNFQPIEQASAQDEDEKSYRVRGYFCTFNDEYLLYPAIPSCDWPATYEQIDRHAFDGCDVSDVIAQFDHSGDVLARTRNGSLKLGFDDHGGYCEMRLDGCQRARDMYESISNGLVVEMSFGFVIADDDDGEGRTYTCDEQGDYHVTITRIAKTYDVSCVSIPANPGTDIESIRKRSYMAPIIEADRKAAEQRSEPEPEDRPTFTEEELEIIAEALERRAKERKAQDDVPPEEEKEERELPDFLKDDDDDEDDDEEKRDCKEDEEQRESPDEEEQRRAARSRRARRMMALSLIDI